MSEVTDRNNKGQFVEGNKAGKGRPSRAIELDYLRTLSDTVTLDDWRGICSKAVEDAKAGNPKARDWVTKYIMGGDTSTSLMDIAVRDVLEITSKMDIKAKVEYLSLDYSDKLMDDMMYQNDVQRATKAGNISINADKFFE